MERLLRKLYFALLSRIHPELNRVEDEDERMRVSMVAGMSEPLPRWSRYLWFAVFMIVLPCTVAVPAWLIASSTKLSSKYHFLVFMGAWMLGALIPMGIFHLVRLHKIR